MSLVDPVRRHVLDVALAQTGQPYRYGGETPAEGFDCSGLVQYSYAAAGHHVPRTARAQRNATRGVRREQLRPGDLVFFEIGASKSPHVGLYLGDERFLHAPSSGGQVRIDRLESPYWRRHFSGGGSLL